MAWIAVMDSPLLLVEEDEMGRDAFHVFRPDIVDELSSLVVDDDVTGAELPTEEGSGTEGAELEAFVVDSRGSSTDVEGGAIAPRGHPPALVGGLGADLVGAVDLLVGERAAGECQRDEQESTHDGWSPSTCKPIRVERFRRFKLSQNRPFVNHKRPVFG